ncbi:MAG: hypothetical protein OEU26_35990 [Candidatus Tectomicrobia bacterium]|nr:hypothetical protein [Candidatus Tectomicrobia bacterium]
MKKPTRGEDRGHAESPTYILAILCVLIIAVVMLAGGCALADASEDLPPGIVVLDDVIDPACSDEGRAMMQLITEGGQQLTLSASGGTLNVSGTAIRGGRQTTLSTENNLGDMLDILALDAKIEITTASSNSFARLLSSGNIDITDAAITDADGASTIELNADKDIVCTGSALDADTVTVSAGGTSVECPGLPRP